RGFAAAVAIVAVLGLSGAVAPAAAGPQSHEAASHDAAGHPVATEARIAGDGGQTRFVMDLTRKVDLRAFTLADPYRVVVDLPQVAFRLPPKTGARGRGLIQAFRF